MDGSEDGCRDGSGSGVFWKLVEVASRLEVAADRLVGSLVGDAWENADRRAAFWKKTSDVNEARWRDLATRRIRERNLRHDIQYAVRQALAVELDDECNCDQALFYKKVLEAVAQGDGLDRDADMASTIADVVRRHGDRLTSAAEHWSREADAALAELRDVEEGRVDDDHESDLKCAALRHRYADMTGHAMAALVLGVELRGELENVGITVEALDELRVSTEERADDGKA